MKIQENLFAKLLIIYGRMGDISLILLDLGASYGDRGVFHTFGFDRSRCVPYTSLFVRDVTNLSGAVPEVLEPLSWKGIIFGPGTGKTEWDGRAAGMGRQPRKAE